MANKKTISTWLTNRFLLIIRNEENFALKKTYSFTYAKLIVFGFTFLAVVFALSFYILTTFLSGWFNPKSAQFEMNKKLLLLSTKVDSLELEVALKDNYILSFKKILEGGESSVHSSELKESKKQEKINLDSLSPVDIQLRKKFEEEKYELLTMSENSIASKVQNEAYISPFNGVIKSGFSLQSGDYGVKLLGKTNEPVKAVADGTIIFSSWTDDAGNVVGIQHSNELISFYKFNSILLKKTGDFVRAGEILAIAGNKKMQDANSQLYFEMWYQGNPVNPEYFISF